MAKNTEAKAVKEAKVKVLYTEVELESGVVLTVPELQENGVVMGFRRKTRHLSPEKQEEEIFWLILETYLTDEELAVWDNLSPEELEEFRMKSPELEKK
jgi:hypothetical protein